MSQIDDILARLREIEEFLETLPGNAAPQELTEGAGEDGVREVRDKLNEVIEHLDKNTLPTFLPAQTTDEEVPTDPMEESGGLGIARGTSSIVVHQGPGGTVLGWRDPRTPEEMLGEETALSYGKAYETTPWGVGDKFIKLHPCDDETGAGEDEDTNITVYIFGCFNGGNPAQAPDGLEVAKNDVLAYLPISTTEGILVSPPLRLPPGGKQYMVLSKASDFDYDYHWDWLRLHGD